MVNEVSWIGIMLIWVSGFLVGMFSLVKAPEPNPITTVVTQPATDDQLVEFWFGNGDKAALRKRICK